MKIESIQTHVQSIIDDIRALDPTSGRYNEELAAIIAQLVDIRTDLKELYHCEGCDNVTTWG